MPLDRDTALRQWQPALVDYWQRLGGQVGEPVAVVAPAGLEHVRTRAVDVRPEIVLMLRPRDVNVVVERLVPLPADEQFDLVVATNVLLYYGPFEQALALDNLSRMLRPGGFLVTSDAVYPAPPMDGSPAQVTAVERDRQGVRDTIFAYERH
jgi:SAM-dependent methyltransferase